MLNLAHAHPRQTLGSLLGQQSPIFTIQNNFKELIDFLSHAPESERVEQLVADMAARLGQRNGMPVCLGMLKPEYKMIAAIMLFRHYGIAFSFETRKMDREKLIYAQARDAVQTKEEQYDAHEFSYSRLTVREPLAVAA
jgi:hypothetical protein